MNTQLNDALSAYDVWPVSGRIQSESTLQRALDGLRQAEPVIDRGPMTIFVWRVDNDWPVEYVSGNVRQFGYSPDDFLAGRVSWPGITHPDDDRRLQDEVEGHFEAGRDRFSCTYRLLTKAGETRWIEDHNVVLRDPDGEIAYVQGAILDITARHEAEESARQFAELIAHLDDGDAGGTSPPFAAPLDSDLMTLIQQRITNDRLRALGQTAAGVMHEINQPLSGIRTLAEHLLVGLDRGWDFSPEALRGKLRQIVEQTDRMEHVMQHAKRFARPDGQAGVTACSLNDILESALSLTASQLRAEGIDLRLRNGEDLPAVVGDPLAFEEVVHNLLANARDAVLERDDPIDDNRGRIVLTTFAETDAEGMARAVLLVEDNGDGIRPEHQARVFEPFFSTKAPERGLGLGMTIVDKIVRNAGGDVQVTSTPKAGTTVRITLPAAQI